MKRSELKADPAKVAAWKARSQKPLKRSERPQNRGVGPSEAQTKGSGRGKPQKPLQGRPPRKPYTCFLAAFSRQPCDGRLIAAHLIDKQALKRKHHDPWDERAYVPACGGLTGLTGHHGAFDARQLTVPRESLPAGVEELASEAGLEAWLERRYGPRED